MKKRNKNRNRTRSRRLKVFFAENGLKPERWKVELETPEYIYAVSVTGQHRLLYKARDTKIEKEYNM